MSAGQRAPPVSPVLRHSAVELTSLVGISLQTSAGTKVRAGGWSLLKLTLGCELDFAPGSASYQSDQEIDDIHFGDNRVE